MVWWPKEGDDGGSLVVSLRLWWRDHLQWVVCSLSDVLCCLSSLYVAEAGLCVVCTDSAHIVSIRGAYSHLLGGRMLSREAENSSYESFVVVYTGVVV